MRNPHAVEGNVVCSRAPLGWIGLISATGAVFGAQGVVFMVSARRVATGCRRVRKAASAAC